MVEDIIIKAIEGLERSLDYWFHKLFHHYPRHRRNRYYQRVRQVIIVRFNNQKYISMDPLQFKVEDGAKGIQASLVDSKTLQPIPDAVATLVSRTSDTPSVATVDAQNNVVPVSQGTFNLTEVNDWDYTDQVENIPLKGIRQTTVQPCVVVEKEGVLQVLKVVDPTPAPAPQG